MCVCYAFRHWFMALLEFFIKIHHKLQKNKEADWSLFVLICG